MIVAFDLDGVLVDTRRALVEAYSLAGVTYPDGAFGRPASSWLVDPSGRVAQEKANAYPLCLDRFGTVLSGVTLLKEARTAGHEVHVVTRASWAGARAALKFARLEDVSFTCCDDKAAVLRHLAAQGVLVDDHDVMVPEGWRLVRYHPGLELREVIA